MDERTKKWLDSLKYIKKIDRIIEQSILGLYLGENWLDEDELTYLVQRREKLTSKPFNCKKYPKFNEDYERMKRNGNENSGL